MVEWVSLQRGITPCPTLPAFRHGVATGYNMGQIGKWLIKNCWANAKCHIFVGSKKFLKNKIGLYLFDPRGDMIFRGPLMTS